MMRNIFASTNQKYDLAKLFRLKGVVGDHIPKIGRYNPETKTSRPMIFESNIEEVLLYQDRLSDIRSYLEGNSVSIKDPIVLASDFSKVKQLSQDHSFNLLMEGKIVKKRDQRARGVPGIFLGAVCGTFCLISYFAYRNIKKLSKY